MTAAPAASQASIESLPQILVTRDGPRLGLERHAAPSTIGIAWLAASARHPIRLAAFPVRVLHDCRETVEIQLNIGLANFLLNPEEARSVRLVLDVAVPADIPTRDLTRLLENMADTAEAIAREAGL